MLGIILILMVGCHTDTEVKSEPENKEPEAETIEVNTEPVEIEFTDYSEEMGFTMEAPTSEVLTTFALNGSVEQHDELQEDYVWVIVRKSESIEEISNREIEYYIPIENGQFDADINLPNGEGDYRVTVRLPATDRDNYFYDTAKFRLTNMDETIDRDVEFMRYGLEKGLQLNEPTTGWKEASEVFAVEGQVSENYTEPSVLAEIKKDGEESM